MVEGEEEARVLLVDDDDSVRRDYSRVLRRAGWQVDTAQDGREAIETLGGTPYGVIVSDISMPGLSGLGFLRAVRQRDLDVPVVLMTGSPDLESAVEAVEYGAFRYLIKPVALPALTGAVKSAMQLFRLARLKRDALEAIGAEGKTLGDRLALETRFESALELISMEFQPIVNWPERRVFGYEALLRSTEPALTAPADLLDAAERLGRVHDLGRAVRREVARATSRAPDGVALFVNLHGLDLDDDELYSSASPLALTASRVVLEITERWPLDGVKGLGRRIAQLRDLGFRIALDDLGAGYAGLNTFTQLEPDFVKLDRALVSGVNDSARKRSVVRSMLRLCGDELGMQVVGEGVETEAERDALGLDGCVLLQGYLFARPGRQFPSPVW
ncbi:MAG TPA: EAL domain-containing response regulator [Kofleriaceae bacterium]|nr:EAL domain-containing response regulator [Kofleriaceae bacterium]